MCDGMYVCVWPLVCVASCMAAYVSHVGHICYACVCGSECALVSVYMPHRYRCMSPFAMFDVRLVVLMPVSPVCMYGIRVFGPMHGIVWWLNVSVCVYA